MKRVLASGVFDIIHAGHLFYLAEAKALGSYLVVVVASDSHAESSKRKPLHDAAERAEIVGALRVVDEVIIGADPYDLVATTRAANPDIIAIGYDQSFNEGELRQELAAHDIGVEVTRLTEFPRGSRKTRLITKR